MKKEEPTVYVIDDDPSVRKALERLLRSAGHKSETFASASEFLDFRPPNAPGCLILDVMMPGLNGLELQERLAAHEIFLPIIFITGHGTIPMSVRAMKAGAADFLQKPFNDEDLLHAISDAIEKDRRARQERKEVEKLRKRLDSLTPREVEVFRLIVTGMLNKQVAFDLGITEKTIKVHRARIMEKMDVKSLADLVRLAEKLGNGSANT